METLRRVRLCYFNTWARELEDAAAYVARVRTLDVRPLVSDPSDAALLRKARLDCDWYGENVRCFASVSHPELEFLPAWTAGPAGLAALAQAPRAAGEERWLIMSGHQPQALGAAAGRAFAALARAGVRHFFYAFDEASRTMPCFREIAPHLNVLVHDEFPLDERGRAALSPACRTVHRSWVANVVSGAAPFNEAPEDRILFLGSQLGLTAHREQQFAFLRKKFQDRFVAYSDHSVAVGDRYGLNRFKVALCPEGRKFTTPAMAQTHTDRPFWTGCLGLVPVAENSRAGDRLEDLHRAGLIVRYAHEDLKGLAQACERALAMTTEERRRIHEHFNRYETVGAVVADAIAAAAAGSLALAS